MVIINVFKLCLMIFFHSRSLPIYGVATGVLFPYYKSFNSYDLERERRSLAAPNKNALYNGNERLCIFLYTGKVTVKLFKIYKCVFYFTLWCIRQQGQGFFKHKKLSDCLQKDRVSPRYGRFNISAFPFPRLRTFYILCANLFE